MWHIPYTRIPLADYYYQIYVLNDGNYITELIEIITLDYITLTSITLTSMTLTPTPVAVLYW